jgi:hypothetical protein
VLEMYDLEDTTFEFKKLMVVSANIFSDKHTKLKCKLSNGRFINVIVFNDPNLYYNISEGDLIDIVGEMKAEVVVEIILLEMV